MKIPHCVPFLAPRQEEYVLDAMRRGQLMRGDYVTRLEDALSELCGGYAVAVSSGTAGLFLAMEAYRKPAYTMPAVSYVAPAQAARMWEAWPEFRDVSPTTWGALEPVDVQIHLYGALAEPVGVIEDACEALGAWRLRSRFGVLSFNQNKIATGGAGGAVLCRADYEARRMRHLIRCARVPGARHVWDMIGWPYEMSNLQAAVACAQLEVLPDTIRRKQEIAAYYRQHLPWITWQESRTYWQPVGLWPGIRADRVVEEVQRRGIDLRHAWPCLADQEPFMQARRLGLLSTARMIDRQGISLPCSPTITREEQDAVIAVLHELRP